MPAVDRVFNRRAGFHSGQEQSACRGVIQSAEHVQQMLADWHSVNIEGIVQEVIYAMNGYTDRPDCRLLYTRTSLSETPGPSTQRESGVSVTLHMSSRS